MSNLKHKTIVLLLLLTITQFTKAQQIKRNSAYVEFAGNTMSYYSINYDRIISLNEQFKLVPRIGFTYIPMKEFGLNTYYGNIRIPIEINALWGKNAQSKNFVEAGIGLSLIQTKIEPQLFEEYRPTYLKFARITTLRAGFRHQKPTGGLMYRVGLLTPIAQDSFSKKRFIDIFYNIYAGVGIGYSF